MPPKGATGTKTYTRELVTLVLASYYKKHGGWSGLDYGYMSALSTLLEEDHEKTKSAIEHEFRSIREDARNLVEKADGMTRAGQAPEPVQSKSKVAGTTTFVGGNAVVSHKRNRATKTSGDDNDDEKLPSPPKKKRNVKVKTEAKDS